MDPALLAEALTIFLAPALPYLMSLGGKAAEEATKEVTKAGVKEAWEKLRPKVEEEERAREAAEDLAEEPDDADNQADFRKQVKKLLTRDAELAGELERTLERSGLLAEYRARVEGSGAIAQDGSVAAGAGGLAAQQVNAPVHLGDVHHHPGSAAPDGGTRAETLREAYLRRLFATLRQLALGGVDPALLGNPKAQLDLDGVYTALLTLGGSGDAEEARRPAERGEPMERQRVSALARLDAHDRLVLLGDPGSGKSTFANFVGLCLAGELLGSEEANLERLREPLPPERPPRPWEDEKEPEPQPWSRSAPLPVRIVLREFAARRLPARRDDLGAKLLLDFVKAELESANLGAYAGELERELMEQGGLVLLDGLDEVPAAEERRVQLKRVVEDFARVFDKCRLLVTSRVYAYQHQDWTLDGFEQATLAPFTPGQIRRFIARWYREVRRRRGISEEEMRGKAALLERAIFGNPRMLELAERPLLLTLMASLHAWRGGGLPEDREELYSVAVGVLLDSWERQRVVLGEKGEPILRQESLAEWLSVDPKSIRAALNELAFEAHEQQEGLEGTADIAESALLARLGNLSENPRARTLVEHLRDRIGLLTPNGVGVYSFPHRTFQEYLAACHLTDCDFPEKIATLARAEPERWREAALLAGAKAARGVASSVWQLAAELSFRDPDHPDAGAEDLWGALLAGQLLAESVDLARSSAANRELLSSLRPRLVAVLRSTLPAVERAAAGRALAALSDPREEVRIPGDPREEVTTLDAMQFCWVPAGPFEMGSGFSDREKPPHENEIPNDYWMARYPVTVAQFRQYVRESGVEPGDSDSLGGAPTTPVVWVSWHEALAFCRWLTERWCEEGLLPAGWRVTLPSEAEWEKAARGGHRLPPADQAPRPLRELGGTFDPGPPAARDNPARAREHPWEGEFDPELASTAETELGEVTAVGCFPRGASPYGCEDMAGNVWEWTRSLWGEDWEKPSFAYPYDPADGREDLEAADSVGRVLRGGSFIYGQTYARCAARAWGEPTPRYRRVGFRLVLSPFSLDSERSGL